jgi:protein gp37
MAKFSSWLSGLGTAWPENVWAGTSITTQATTSRIDSLLKVGDQRTIRFLSVEPQIEQIDLCAWLPEINWVIQGGESGPKGRPFDLAWADELIDQCHQHNVPLFIKQLGSHVVNRGEQLVFQDTHTNDWSEWPERLKVRQMPEATI